jgi:hypothetical protein
MTSPAEPHTEAAPAHEAPAVIHLPPPADMAPAKARHGSEKRQRSRVGFFRYDDEEFAELEKRARDAGLSVSAYGRECTVGRLGKPPRRRPRRIATVETAALMTALVAFNRANNNQNQLARTGNTLVLFAEEHGCERLAEMARELVLAVENLREDFAAPVAAILAAFGYDPEG